MFYWKGKSERIFFWGGGLENFVVVAPGPRKENCRGQRNRALSDS